ncbi:MULTISPECIES: ABC transporter substrate-binding protein [Streptomycetaceae]|uniref:Putative ABC transporter substrate-binding protein n=1 Tax=Streptantibioticus cattleyicolor (strain ATCC 35852 / DSM 46488 / JCM 4925 / NBRC 14057 / NRRL 8057) TaxID=1003195 RepID=F8JWY8_STREN|nr:ABC transporter substrate-binding protein [Streptantibioticus cattleyicolor]AEW93304.1 putative ABC transporter substrate-binding protein [Streptantibioticus cattleyicolor NRRL 8057 = DSM 46488]MYS58023.1 transporter substrate-binding domain-containing protein [Streptomyces sp. SID5468]CCB73664.1 putative ABC transporter substrate-binding protein [Streptantibioticus cattleyicolor NRRL 8057 = DSM 46488]
MITRTAAAATAVLVMAGLLSGCGPGATGTADPVAAPAGSRIDLGPDQHRIRAAKVAAIAAEVPAAVRARGTLVIGGTADTAPPLSFYATDDKTPIGVEYDIATLVADTLGLRPRFEVASWEQLFVGLDSGAYDAGFANITVTEERKERYDFATYRLDELAFEAPKDAAGWKVTGPKDVAGKTIAVSSGTNQEKILLDWSAKDVKAGLKPVDVRYYQRASDYYLALQSHRIDAYLGPDPTAAYHCAVSGRTRIVGTLSGGGSLTGKIAATTRKGDGLVKAYADAINEVIRNGDYAKVLARWGLSAEAVPRSEINPPGLPRTSQ